MKKTILFISLFLLTGALFTSKASAITGNFTTNDNDCAPPPDTIKTVPVDNNPASYFLALAKKITLTGYSQVRYQYLEGSAHTNSFDIRRARLNFKGEFTSKLSYQLQLEFAGSPKILDANAEYAFNQLFKIKVGQFKVPMSYEEFYLDRGVLISINGAQITEALTGNSTDVLGNNNGRDIGGMVSGSYSGSGKFNLVEYYAGVFNGNGSNVVDNNSNKDYVGRIRIQPIKGLWVAGFYYNGKANYGTGKDLTILKTRDRWGGELVFTRDRITFNAEYIHGLDNTTNREGYYGQLAGFVIPKKLQLLVKYDNYNSNIDLTNAVTTVTTAGVNYYFTPLSRVMVNYEWHTEKGTHVNNNLLVAEFQVGF